ncbi:MAG: hypothetical protein ABI199_07795 [Bacteroidia bacterium]
MGTTKTSGEEKQSNSSSAEKQQKIENHKKAAKCHEEAAKHHHEAIRYHEAGEHDKANESTLKAHAYHSIAGEVEREGLIHNVVRI